MEKTEEKNKTENDYLEMANDCKNRLEEKEKEIKQWKLNYMLVKKEVCNIYGLIRSLNTYLENSSPEVAYDPVAEYFLDDIRRITREVIFEEEEKKLGVSTTEEFRIIIENLENVNL